MYIFLPEKALEYTYWRVAEGERSPPPIHTSITSVLPYFTFSTYEINMPPPSNKNTGYTHVPKLSVISYIKVEFLYCRNIIPPEKLFSVRIHTDKWILFSWAAYQYDVEHQNNSSLSKLI